ncbi:MAG: ABC transporter ATP-binding protein [Endomicrobiia bacterium]|nr:ABC transporter ATP-binding protein [Endomicrobiaceae bacterium]MDD3053719.1 ABC transporter ATP-binding protein [Endomicrobiaceae bacterium]MDD3922756.1 ABC transporter ATP-binding protein [Endomicrobiaceae bacterium]MDD5102199.1 ABC transporter ATP-binding protein [Endomicrobiaceae bacterium]
MDYKRLLNYIKPYKARFILAMVCMGIFSALTGATMWLVKNLFDKIFIAKDMKMLTLVALLIPIFFALKGIVDYGRSYLLNYIAQNVVKTIRNELYEKLISLSHNFYVKNSSSRIMSRITNDINALQGALLRVPPSVFRDGLTVIVMIGVLFYLHWKFAFITVVVMPLVSLPLILFARKMRKASKEGQVQMAEIYSSLQEMLSGFSVIKAFCQENHEKDRFKGNNEKYYGIQQRLVRVDARSSPIMEALGACGVAIVLWFGGKDVVNGVWTSGAFVAFLGAVFSMYQPLKNFAQVNSTIQQAVTASERIFEILDEEPTIVDSSNAIEMPKFSKDIVYKNVSFDYGVGKQILNNINVTIPIGKTVAFVGSSGSGKTTIANLLLRFYDVKSGEILIDGKNIQDFEIKSLRSQIGVVSQDVMLFNDTIKYNIAYAKLDATDQEIEAVAKAANAYNFISKMPEKYDTLVGERGMKVSGGEKQRIAIARAMLKNPPILILDEATSALDSESEKLVQEAIENLMKNRTVVLIAHRLATVKNADKIIVIDKGNIAEEGTHQELLAKNNIYAKLYNMQ